MMKILMIGIFSLQCIFGILLADETTSTKDKIRERLQKFGEALNQGNVDVLSSYWTEDAEFTHPVSGEVLKGKNEINQFLQKSARELNERHLLFTFKPAEVEMIDNDHATVQGAVEISDQGSLVRRNARKIGLLKQNGVWYINSVSEIEVAPAPPIYEHLKELEWFIGNWKDKDEDVTITFNTKWDQFKNFIFQHFKMEVYGLEAIEGLQIIGWDPIENKIHSWVFDSDGGVGSGSWTKEGNRWLARLHFVLSDGSKGSVLNIYTKKDPQSYTFASMERKLNDKTLPDIEPVTVVKEE